MGNISIPQASACASSLLGQKSPALEESTEQQKNMTCEYEQSCNPLARAFQKGILNKGIIASNNILLLSHQQIASEPHQRKKTQLPHPRVSLDELLLSRQSMEKIKKISCKNIEEGSVYDQSTSSDEKEKEAPRPREKSRIFKPIVLNQENLIKIQEGNINKKYKMLHKIGEGGFGTVFKAICLTTHEERAVKVISLHKHSYMNKKIILNEIAMLLKLDHPNIIKLYEIIENEDTYYIVTEYCDGGTLADYLSKHKREKGELLAKEVMTKLLSAVKYLHSKNIIHRDLKLDNIVVKTIKGQQRDELIIKVIDFGLAIQSFSLVAKSDKIIGTPQYIAPQSTLGMYSPKSDIWGCGIVLYMLFVGQSPFRAPTKSKVFKRIKKEEIDLQNQQWRLVSLQAKDLLYRMLSKCSINRPSAGEALNHAWFANESIKKSSRVSGDQKEQIARVLTQYQKRNNLLSFIETYTCLTKISQNQREKLIRHFNRIDSDRNGFIEFSQLKAYFSKSKVSLSQQEIINILQKIDLNQNERIDLNQFICALSNIKEYYQGTYVEELFGLFDRNGDGFIQQRELKIILEECHSEEIGHLFRAIDSNEDGRISLDEFRSYLLKNKENKWHPS